MTNTIAPVLIQRDLWDCDIKADCILAGEPESLVSIWWRADFSWGSWATFLVDCDTDLRRIKGAAAPWGEKKISVEYYRDQGGRSACLASGGRGSFARDKRE